MKIHGFVAHAFLLLGVYACKWNHGVICQFCMQLFEEPPKLLLNAATLFLTPSSKVQGF